LTVLVDLIQVWASYYQRFVEWRLAGAFIAELVIIRHSSYGWEGGFGIMFCRNPGATGKVISEATFDNLTLALHRDMAQPSDSTSCIWIESEQVLTEKGTRQ